MEAIFGILIVTAILYIVPQLISKLEENNGRTASKKVQGSSEPVMWKGMDVQKCLDELSKLPEESSEDKGYFLFLDTETTGLPKRRNAEPEELDNWPYVVELAWLLTDKNGLLIDVNRFIIKQDVIIPQEAINVHHITNEKMNKEGSSPKEVYSEFIKMVNNTEYIIAHNIEFDLPILQCELIRNGFDVSLKDKKLFCTMKRGKEFTDVTDSSGRAKYPKLVELFSTLYFDTPIFHIKNLHNALSDTLVLYRSFMKMLEKRPNILNEKEPKRSKSSSFKYVPINDPNRLSGDILKKDLSNADPTNKFYNKKVVITGIFPIERRHLAEILKYKCGADIDLSVSKTTVFLLKGIAPGPMKIEKAKELGTTILSEEEVMDAIKDFL